MHCIINVFNKLKEEYIMGFIKAFTGALGGTFADQWKDFYMPMEGVPATAPPP